MRKHQLVIDARWSGPHGIGRFATEVISRLEPQATVEALPLLHPTEPLWLSWQLRKYRSGVYFSPGFNPPLWSPVPFVFTIHDLIHLDVAEEASRTKRLYYDAIVRPAARRAARVLTVSEYSRQRILAWADLPENHVVNVGNGVDVSFTPNGPRYQPGYPYVLYVGNRKPHKNVPRLLEAFARLNDPELRLVLSGAADDDILHRALRLGIHQRVVYAGVIPEVDLPAYYRGASVLAFPSLYEGFGLPALEAMACGTPVVAANATSLPEVVGKAAILVDPLDVRSISEGLRIVLDDEEQRTALAWRGLERAKLFSWERTASNVMRVLEEAAQHP